MKNIAIYYRVSTDRQDFDSQRSAIQAWLKGRFRQSTREFTDYALSGRNKRRPGFEAMLEAAKNKEIDTIIVYRLDRFSRDATAAIKTILELDQLGVAFISVSQAALNLGHEMPFRRTMLAAFAEIAEIERDTIIARVKSGLEAAKQRGVKLGPPIKATPELSAKIIALRRSGHSFQQISNETKLSVFTCHSVCKKSKQFKKRPRMGRGRINQAAATAETALSD